MNPNWLKRAQNQYFGYISKTEKKFLKGINFWDFEKFNQNQKIDFLQSVPNEPQTPETCPKTISRLYFKNIIPGVFLTEESSGMVRSIYDISHKSKILVQN